MRAAHEDRGPVVRKDSREMVTFCIGEQDFCMDIMTVREIRGWTEATVLPRAPDYVLGVINLRGAVVPIIDLSSRLGLAPLEPFDRTAWIRDEVPDDHRARFNLAVALESLADQRAGTAANHQ